MGYYTKYQLKVLGGDRLAQDEPCPHCNGKGVVNELILARNELDEPQLDFLKEGEATKWYSHHEDMTELADKYPSVTFVLEGIGEEQGDVWRSFYKGKQHYHQQAKPIVFDDFPGFEDG